MRFHEKISHGPSMCLLPLNENFRHSRRRRFRHSYVVGCGVAKTNFFHFLIEKETLGQNDRSACLRSQVSLPFEEKNEIPPFYCCMSFCLNFLSFCAVLLKELLTCTWGLLKLIECQLNCYWERIMKSNS